MAHLPLLVIAGPTAAGKTRIALAVAEAAAGEIINADSMQIYRHLDIGTAKPTVADRERVPFHLLDIVAPDEPYSVADFQRDVRRTAEGIAGRGRLPILCGGTGLYVRAIVEGFRFPPRPEDAGARRRLEREFDEAGAEAMHARLAQTDPRSAQRIHLHDRNRIVRALEVLELTSRPISEQQAVDSIEAIRYNAAQFVIDRPREVLYQAIERRVDEMLQAGWLSEARRLLQTGYGLDLQSMQALGYQWLFRHLRGELDLGEATRLIKRDTRRFAKRQLTWFRRQAGLIWLSWTDDAEIPHLVGRLVTTATALRSAAPPARPRFGGDTTA